MPRNLETTAEVKTFMPREEYAQIKTWADANNVEVADLLRDALRDYMKRKGVRLKLAVKRGRKPD